MKKLVFIAEIDWKNSPKVRAGLVPEVVEDYAERYRKREEMPAPLIGDLGALGFWCLDGMHRLHALKKNGQKGVTCEVVKVTEEEALKLALTQNEQHGLRRSNDDKRRCVSTALLAWPEKSNLAIAQLTKVDDKTVAAVRKEMEKAGDVDKSVVRKDTKDREVKPRVSKDALVDATGLMLPKEIRGIWQEGMEVADSLTNNVASAKGELSEAQKSKDILFTEINFSAAIGDLERVFQAVQAVRPYSVCPTCNGYPELQEKGCAMCKSRGFISKFRWDSVVPDELKKLRKQMVKDQAKEGN